jgi:hypothetical protein
MTMSLTTPSSNSFTSSKSGVKNAFEDSYEKSLDIKDKVGWDGWEDGWFAKPKIAMPDVKQTAVAQEINHPDLNKPIASIDFVTGTKTLNFASASNEVATDNSTGDLKPFWLENTATAVVTDTSATLVKEVGQGILNVSQEAATGAMDLVNMLVGTDSKPTSKPLTEEEQKSQANFNFVQNAIREQTQAAKQVEFNQQEEIAKTIARITDNQVSYGDIAQEAGGSKVALVTAFEIASERTKKIEAANNPSSRLNSSTAGGPSIDMNLNNKESQNAVQYITG